ncbi:hypothetical protein Sste5346_009237 [Sporothrix stenoceras]|uniref:Centromere protein X n=1 Tax=Sporothrix stenoceras TaxID=5173 RepID=A0ABR3YKW3_9PEZI
MPPQISSARPGARGTPTGSSSGFRGTGAFKPPRPVAGAARSTTAATSTSKSSRSRAVDVEISDDDNDNSERQQGREQEEDDDVDELERSRISSANQRRRTIDQFQEGQEAEEGAATDVATDNDDDIPEALARKTLPPALLTRLLYHFFQNQGGTPTRMTQDAHASVNKYMEIFIREAVARSVAERGNGAFLDVDVLQKVAGQLIMDM